MIEWAPTLMMMRRPIVVAWVNFYLCISDTIQTIFCWWRYELIFKHRRTCWLLMWLVLCFTHYILYYLHTWAIQHSSVQQVEFVTIFTWKKNIILVPTFCFPPVILKSVCMGYFDLFVEELCLIVNIHLFMECIYRDFQRFFNRNLHDLCPL